MVRGGPINLLPQTTLAGAVTAVVTSPVAVASLRGLLVEAIFLYGAGGTNAKVWVQTRVGGGTWRDIMNFAFTTAAATKWNAVQQGIAVAAVIAVSDGALADNTILDGFLGDELRLKYTTTGTYSGATSLQVQASPAF